MFILTIILALGIVWYLVVLIDTVLGSSGLTSNREARLAICGIIKTHYPDAHTFYDLGCSTGTLIHYIQTNFPTFRIYGIDKNPWRIFLAKLKSHKTQRAIFLCQDIFKTDLRNADIVYAYLFNELMCPLEVKLLNELKTGAIVITNTNRFPTWSPAKIYTYIKHGRTKKLFVYKKPH